MRDSHEVDYNIDYFADHPEFLDEVAKWLHDEWAWQNPGENSVADRLQRMQAQMHKERIPMMFVAFAGDHPVGTAWIVEHDMDSRKDLSPWVATIFVRPEYRGKGIGSALVLRAMDKVRQLGYKQAYLITPDREGFYARLGWRTMEKARDRNRMVFLMTTEFVG